MGGVASYAALEDGNDFIGKFVKGAVAVGYGSGLEAVEFVEGAVDGGVGDEVVDVVVFGGEALSFVYEGGRACEGVVNVAD